MSALWSIRAWIQMGRLCRVRTFQIPVVRVDLLLDALALCRRLLVAVPDAAARDDLADHWQAYAETHALQASATRHQVLAATEKLANERTIDELRIPQS